MMDLKNPSLLKTQAYVNGEWRDGPQGRRFPVTNPATGAVLAQVADLGAEETRAAILAANDAWDGWRSRTAKERAAVLRRWYELVTENQEDLAAIMTAEQGKPLAEARGEVGAGATFLEWFAEEAKRAYGDVIPTHKPGARIVVVKEPIGVAAAITPWNFPFSMITRKCAPALAAGCPVVVKPAEDTPLSALALASLAEQAGVPKGIFNVVTGSDPVAIAGELTASRLVRKLSFTGSTEVGKILMRQCADTVKKVSLELGGNAPLIVFDDADLDVAVAGAIASKYRNVGQTCVCANRILVQSTVYDAFAAKLTAAASALVVGNGADPGVQQGPLINAQAISKVQELVDDALAKGATLTTGGKRHGFGPNYFEPTVLTGVTTDMRVAREEIFGPVAPLFRFDTEDEAVRLANDTEYGLAAYFYSRDVGRAWRVAERLEYGMVGINESLLATEVAPFGGIKESGIGREGSKYGMDDFLEVKYLCVGL
ncbi:NAD-dependent succinate-semialdehyde dehydrogenase [Azospirillum himalayense]|uniref:NAD-dependent succinate-semialdehyde dehydrogenase n=1 Tax=Azospirillum himalayense TaxID=654847 RepID=A0ABW0GDJ8_9PROT